MIVCGCFRPYELSYQEGNILYCKYCHTDNEKVEMTISHFLQSCPKYDAYQQNGTINANSHVSIENLIEKEFDLIEFCGKVIADYQKAAKMSEDENICEENNKNPEQPTDSNLQ